MNKVVIGAFLASLVVTSPAWAQDKPVEVNIGGGFTVPLSDVSDRFSTGGNFNAGVTFNVAPTVGIQAEYGYNRLSGNDTYLPKVGVPGGPQIGQILIQSHHAVHMITFNGVFKTPGSGKVGAYAIAGPGIYNRTVSLTTPDVGFATVCDPYWYVCYPVAVEVDRIIGDRNSWDMGINFGGGVTFKLGDSAQFYVETRWHYIWGPEFTNLQGQSVKANGQYMPVTFGLKF